MATHLLEGFGQCADGAAGSEHFRHNWLGYTNAGTIVDLADGRKYITKADDNGIFMLSRGLGWLTEYHFGFRVWWPGGNDRLFDLKDFAGNLTVTVGILSSGSVVVSRHLSSISIDIAGQSTNLLSTNTWHHVELRILHHNTTGEIDFYIDGLLSNQVTGADTIATGGALSQIVLGPATATHDFLSGTRLTDISVDDALRGPQKYIYRPSASAGSYSTWTAVGAPSIYEALDDIGHDADTSYAKIATASGKFGVGFSTIPTGTIKTIHPILVAKRPLGGFATLAVGLKSGGTEDNGTQQGVTEGQYTGVRGGYYDTDPNTGAAWVTANANAAEIVGLSG